MFRRSFLEKSLQELRGEETAAYELDHILGGEVGDCYGVIPSCLNKAYSQGHLGMCGLYNE